MSQFKIMPEISMVDHAGFPAGFSIMEYYSNSDGFRDNAFFRPAPAGGDWVVVLHGFGSHGNQLFMRKDIRRTWLPVYLERGLGLLTPNLRNDPWMNPAAVEDMDSLLDFFRDNYGARRFFFESGSMGASGSLIYAALRPDNVAGVVARGAATDLAAYHGWCRAAGAKDALLGDIADSFEAAYGGTPEENTGLYRLHSPIFHVDNMKGIPIYLLHGTQDGLMPVSQSRRFAGAMGDNPLFAYVEIADGPHDAPLSVPGWEDSAIRAPLKWVVEKAG